MINENFLNKWMQIRKVSATTFFLHNHHQANYFYIDTFHFIVFVIFLAQRQLSTLFNLSSALQALSIFLFLSRQSSFYLFTSPSLFNCPSSNHLILLVPHNPPFSHSNYISIIALIWATNRKTSLGLLHLSRVNLNNPGCLSSLMLYS